MNADREDAQGAIQLQELMLDAYGADIRRWPRGRLQGLWGILTSAAFRRRVQEARALDDAVRDATPILPSGDRLERRLLLTMGFNPEFPPSQIAAGLANRINPGWLAAGFALCLTVGVAFGGVFGGEALQDSVYASLSDDDWSDLDADAYFPLEDAG